MLYAFCLLLAILPVGLFLLALVALDSYKLVRLRVVLRLLALGGGIAGLCLFLNPLLHRLLETSAAGYVNYVAPPIEEVLKGAVLMAAIARRRLGFLVDAAIWGFAVGAGFAVVENVHYFLYLDRLEPSLWIVRGFGTALMHGGATAIGAIVSHQLTERRDSHRPHLFLPGLLLAALFHSAFNHFFLSPNSSTLLVLLALPATFAAVYWISERATQNWLGTGFDGDQDLLRQIKQGRLGESRIGRYLLELKSHFPPAVMVDMHCLILLHVELSLKAKGILMLRKAGLEPVPDADLAERFAELRQLERSIGKTGRLALNPIFHLGRRELWQLHMLGEKRGGLTNFLLRQR